jgi:Tetratricopeptide repeat
VAPTTALVDDLVERVRSAVFSGNAQRRGWDAVRAAALLRRQGRHEGALELLDDVVARFEYPDIVSAAHACAVAVHCDRSDPAMGIKVGRPAWNDRQAPELGNALARAYWEQFERTGDVADREAWARFKESLFQPAASTAQLS